MLPTRAIKKNFFIWKFVIPTCIMYCVSCSKSNVLSSSQTNSPKDSGADIISYQIEGMNSNVSIDFPNVNLLFGDSITNGKVSVASFVLSPGAHASINEITQVSGITQNN